MHIDQIPVIDTHCHPFPPSQSSITAQQLRDALSVSLRGESAIDNETTLLSRMTIRQLAKLLDCDATWEAVVATRNERAQQSPKDYHNLLWKDANISAVLIDAGYPLTPRIATDEFAEVVPCTVYSGYRVERFYSGTSFHEEGFNSIVDFVDAFEERLDTEASRPETKFFKTVIAYQTGLSIELISETRARQAWDQHERFGDSSTKTIRDHLFMVAARKAAEHGLPFQVHTGHTSHINLWPNVNPILLTPLLNEPSMADVQLVLVHGGYPYCTEAGYLTSVYPNVALDLSLMIPWASIGVSRRIEETLESAPTSKIMYGSDAIQVPELFWISAKNARRALVRVLDRLVNDDVIGVEEFEDIAHGILHRNAERIYDLSPASASTD